MVGFVLTSLSRPRVTMQSDLLVFFLTYGSPNNRTGDIHSLSYLFIGDFVDRGRHSLEASATSHTRCHGGRSVP
jgi:hypothetical protein